jgi:tyrosyl-tRNA synthetase
MAPSGKQKERLMTMSVEEIVKRSELEEALEKKEPKAYIGFEPSGKAHIAWLMMMDKVLDLTTCGFKVDILLADWHAYINDKLGGDIDNIKGCGKYMEECFTAMGIDLDRTRFVYASEYIGDPLYWELVMRIGKAATLTRVKRAMTIMGRKEKEAELDSSKMLYPLMQVADIFYLNVDVALGGLDQRKAHMLARDIAPKLGCKPPVALHTPLNAGLQGGDRMDPFATKMSKSKPDTAIFVNDTPADIKRKLKKAYCPAKEVAGNPILDIARNIIFNRMDVLVFKRPAKFGGDIQFEDYATLERAYVKGDLHPADLKKGIGEAVIELLGPVRAFFEKNPKNLEFLESIGTTR